jgi:predicted dehydrogenase
MPIDAPSGEVYELVSEIEAMVRAVRGEAPLHATGEDGRAAVALCLQAIDAIKRNR